jgi:hypothetical protein
MVKVDDCEGLQAFKECLEVICETKEAAKAEANEAAAIYSWACRPPLWASESADSTRCRWGRGVEVLIGQRRESLRAAPATWKV